MSFNDAETSVFAKDCCDDKPKRGFVFNN
jgi:hypothetical protein